MTLCEDKLKQATHIFELDIKTDQTNHLNYTFTEKESKADYMYFSIFDCDGLTARLRGKQVRLKMIMDMRNSETSHYEAGDEKLIHWFTFFAFVFLAIFAAQAKQFYKEMVSS